jgi:hypothetical protein
MSDPRPNVATGIDWVFAPDWLTIEQACFLSSHDRGAMLEIISDPPRDSAALPRAPSVPSV